MTLLQFGYLLLAALGLCTTMYFNVAYYRETGTFDVIDFVLQLYVSNAGSSIMNDLLVAYTAFLCWVIVETRRLGMRGMWIFVALSLVAFAFAFPLFLFYRERFNQQNTPAQSG